MSKGESSSKQVAWTPTQAAFMCSVSAVTGPNNECFSKTEISTVTVYLTPHWALGIAIWPNCDDWRILLPALTETWSLWADALLSVIDTTMGYNNLLVFSAKEQAVDGYNSKSVDCLTLDSLRLSTKAQLQTAKRRMGFQ